MLFSHLDDAAITGGAPGYSLAAQHLTDWFKDQRRWLDALYRAWVSDPELGAGNAEIIASAVAGAVDRAVTALRPLAARADALVGAGTEAALEEAATILRAAHSVPQEV